MFPFFVIVRPDHPRDFKVTYKVFFGSKIELHFSWKPPLTAVPPVHTYWIKCNRSTANGKPLVPLSIRIALPTLHLKTKINAEPYIRYQCYSYATNDVGNGPHSRTMAIQPIPLGK